MQPLISFVALKASGDQREECLVATHSKITVQRAILHVLSDNHDRMMFGHHALSDAERARLQITRRSSHFQVDDIFMFELSHDTRFGEKVQPGFLDRSLLQCFDRHAYIEH